MTEPNYWLMKSEPDAYSIDTLKSDGVTLWDGIRNYQARNFMRKMNIGDQVFFYHSNCKPPGIVGLMKVIDFIFENFRSNFFIIKKSTLRFLRLSIFCRKLEILKLSKFLLKNIFGIGSKVNTPIFEEYFFLYFLANENNF
mgnify:CR=1 FL=1